MGLSFMASLSNDVNFIMGLTISEHNLNNDAINLWDKLKAKNYKNFIILNMVKKHFIDTYAEKNQASVRFILSTLNRLDRDRKSSILNSIKYEKKFNKTLKKLIDIKKEKVWIFIREILSDYSISDLRSDIKKREEMVIGYMVYANKLANKKFINFQDLISEKMGIVRTEIDIHTDSFRRELSFLKEYCKEEKDLFKDKISFLKKNILKKDDKRDEEDMEICAEFLALNKDCDFITFDKIFKDSLTKIRRKRDLKFKILYFNDVL